MASQAPRRARKTHGRNAGRRPADARPALARNPAGREKSAGRGGDDERRDGKDVQRRRRVGVEGGSRQRAACQAKISSPIRIQQSATSTAAPSWAKARHRRSCLDAFRSATAVMRLASALPRAAGEKLRPRSLTFGELRPQAWTARDTVELVQPADNDVPLCFSGGDGSRWIDAVRPLTRSG